MRKRSQHSQSAIPLSGQVVGAAFSALRIPYPDNLRKEMQRYFRGERIHNDNREQILYLLADRLLEEGVIPRGPMDSVFSCEWGAKKQIVVAISQFAEKWDSLREELSYWPLPALRQNRLLSSSLRLVVIDLAVRVASFRRLAKLPPMETLPLWAQSAGNTRFLRQLKDTYGKGLTNEAVASSIGVQNEKTVPDWLYRGKRPSTEHITALAKLFSAHAANLDVESLRGEINRHYVLSDLSTRLAKSIGRENVLVLALALVCFSSRLQQFLAEEDPKPAEPNWLHYLPPLVHGIWSSGLARELKQLWQAETDLEWRRDIVCVERDWMDRLTQQGLRFAGETIVRRAHSVTYSPFNPDQISPTFAYISATYADHRIDSEMDIWQGSGDEAYRWNEKTEAELRDAVQRDGSNARAHLNLGVYLGFEAFLPGDMEKGFRECLSAEELRPQWDLPKIECAHILMRAGKYSEAVLLLEKAKDELPHTSAPLAYSLGFARMLNSDFRGALSVFEQAATLKPGYALALDNAAYCAFKLGDTVVGRKHAKEARLWGISTTYDLYDVGKTKEKRIPIPFQILCETVPCRQQANCPGRVGGERAREQWVRERRIRP